jgi:spoIIIJ-associated protein
MDDTATKELIREFVSQLGITIDEIEEVTLAAHRLWNIRTPDSKRLIGPQGEHLRALNYLLRRMAERQDTLDERVMVDVNGYQLGRIRELEQKARLLADRVRTFRSSAELTPMNAYERMIIHAMFSEDPEVTTESEGFGKTRHVILKYRTEE